MLIQLVYFSLETTLVQVGSQFIGTAVWVSHFDSSHFCKLEPTNQMGQIQALPFSRSISSFCSPVEGESPPVLRMGMEDPNALLWAALYEGNLSILNKLTHQLIDFRALHPKTGVTVLLYVIDRSLERKDLKYPGIEITKWLLSMGADATQKVSPRSRCKPIKLSVVDYDRYDDFGYPGYEYEVAIPFAGHSAISYVVEFKRVLAEHPGNNFDPEETFLQKFWATIAHSISAEEVQQKVSIDRSLMTRWERILNDTSTHNVTFETADNPVTAHDWMLREASLVLKAMLESSMQLGSVFF